MSIGYADEEGEGEGEGEGAAGSSSSSSLPAPPRVRASKVVEIPSYMHPSSSSHGTGLPREAPAPTASTSSAFTAPLAAHPGPLAHPSLVRSEQPRYLSDDREALLVHRELEFAAAEFKCISESQVSGGRVCLCIRLTDWLAY